MRRWTGLESARFGEAGRDGHGESSSIDSRSFASGEDGKTGIVPAHLPCTENANANPSDVEACGAHSDIGHAVKVGKTVAGGLGVSSGMSSKL